MIGSIIFLTAFCVFVFLWWDDWNLLKYIIKRIKKKV